MNVLKRKIKIGIVAGELSGDVLGANLVKKIKKYIPTAIFFGITGKNMKKVGVQSWYNIEDINIMGIIEVIKHLPRLFRIRCKLINKFRIMKPDIFIGIDAPDFTIPLERKLKKMGIYTIHYISPSVWAWRKNRIFKINKSVNNLFVVFPFEKKIYDQFKIPCKFIGHTLADSIPLFPNKALSRIKLGIPKNALCLAILPGSRINEIKILGPIFFRASSILVKYFPELNILIPLANKSFKKLLENIKQRISPFLSIRYINNQSVQTMISSDIALLASGTASLECMLAKCPMVVGYKVHALTFSIIKRMVNTKWISIPNLLSKKEIVTELLQELCCAENIVKCLLDLLKNKKKRDELIKKFHQLHKKIKCNADEQAAKFIIKVINNRFITSI